MYRSFYVGNRTVADYDVDNKLKPIFHCALPPSYRIQHLLMMYADGSELQICLYGSSWGKRPGKLKKIF